MIDGDLSIGSLVAIDVQDPAYANRGAWIVLENNYNRDRVVVEQTNSEGQCCRIVVSRSNCQDFMLLSSRRLDVWIPLPGKPGNSILLGSWPGVKPVLSWPFLTELGIGVKFRSVEFGCEREMEFFDVLKMGPAGHLWPFCLWCGKFYFPCEGGHSESFEHQRALVYLQDHGAEVCGELMRQYGWWGFGGRSL